MLSLAFPRCLPWIQVAFPLLAKERDATRQTPWERGGYLGSCSVVRKIMSVPCGAVSGDRSQMQPLLYGRLSFSAENSLPPSQTSSKTFSRYCGSLRLKRGEKRGGGGGSGGREGFPSPPLSLLLPPDLSGVRGGRDRALPQPGGPGLPPRPQPAASTPPSTGSLVQVSGGRRRAGPAAGGRSRGGPRGPSPLPRSVSLPGGGDPCGGARVWAARWVLLPQARRGGDGGRGRTPRPAPRQEPGPGGMGNGAGVNSGALKGLQGREGARAEEGTGSRRALGADPAGTKGNGPAADPGRRFHHRQPPPRREAEVGSPVPPPHLVFSPRPPPGFSSPLQVNGKKHGI